MGLRVWSCWLGISTAVLYGSLSLFISILHNVFLLYYVETFVSVYKIDKVSFWVGETVFLIWNSLNDPLFGWLSDHSFLSSPQSGQQIASPEVVVRRLRSVARHGPLFALSFLAFWVAWARPGLQFLVCLCLYDGFLTAVDLSHSALLADLAVSAADRTQLNFYCSLFSAVGSLSVFLSYSFWDKDDLSSFRLFCVALAALSALGFAVASRLLRRKFQGEARPRLDEDEQLRELCVGQAPLVQEKAVTLGEYLSQLSKHKNFMWFVSMNLVQVFHCHFNSNFFPLFLEHLLSDRISPSTGSFLLGISYIAPHVNNLYFLTLCKRFGVYEVVRWLFILKLALSGTMLLAGADQIYLLCFFIASNRVFTEGTCKLLNLVVTDLVDEDFVLNRRQQAASALLFGMVALVTKPGQTFAPLVGTWLLCVYTGYDIFERDVGHEAVQAAVSSREQAVTLRQGCFYLLVFVPVTCALLQLLTWSRFTLHGKHLQHIKALRQGAQHCRPTDVKAI
ncbi:transmembrane protein 180 [Conger conger]|uniref:transmembrane protein 180 n=1 Tax=Conger conger TaxID=82655 RepID=UPI002A5ADE59|nr:transmembrane protein 180 [Conger conger]XP_061089225.1 transmembrane protein 180 [Conger conger]